MTTRRPNHVPKFGNWDANDHVPFTKVFESARAGKGANNKLINPNDPSQNPEGFGLRVAKEENMIGKPFGDGQTPVDVQKHKGAAGGTRNNGGFSNGVGGDRPSAVHQGRFNNRRKSYSSPPSRDVKVPSEEGTATTSRHGGSKGNETPDRSPALPRFGDWNEKDPRSADGFTMLFNQARNEKISGGPVRIPALQAESPARVEGGNHRQARPQQNLATKKPLVWGCCLS